MAGFRMKSTKKNRTRRPASTSGENAKGKLWKFPQNALEDTLKIAQAIEDKNAGNPMNPDELAKAVGYSIGTNDPRFSILLKSANQYGLVSGSGKRVPVKMEKLGEDIISPNSPNQRQEALTKAFKNVKDFQDVLNFYKNKIINVDEFFKNNLIRQFSVPKDRVEKFISVFMGNKTYLDQFSEKVKSNIPITHTGNGINEEVDREHLSTGETHGDRYCSQILRHLFRNDAVWRVARQIL